MAIGFETLLVDDEREHCTCCSFELLLLMALLMKNGKSLRGMTLSEDEALIFKIGYL